MKTIGMIGGMSWESSAEYYRIINETVKERLGGHHSCKCLMFSFDFDEIEKLQDKGEWGKLTEIMIKAAVSIEKGGAEMLIICTNTMHLMSSDMEKVIKIPILHIVDVVAKRIKAEGMKKVGLLGTRFTMEMNFYIDRLKEKHGIDVVVPNKKSRDIVHNIIIKELVLGKTKNESREEYKNIIYELAAEGAEGVILACTEIPLLIKQKDVNIPVFDTTQIHAEAAVETAIN